MSRRRWWGRSGWHTRPTGDGRWVTLCSHRVPQSSYASEVEALRLVVWANDVKLGCVH